MGLLMIQHQLLDQELYHGAFLNKTLIQLTIVTTKLEYKYHSFWGYPDNCSASHLMGLPLIIPAFIFYYPVSGRSRYFQFCWLIDITLATILNHCISISSRYNLRNTCFPARRSTSSNHILLLL